MGVWNPRRSRQKRLAEVERVVSSRTFQGSEALAHLLQYLARQSLENPDSPIKEYRIATEVLGRRDDFDPRIDASVRVQMGRLRAKLAEYYAAEGKNDSVTLGIPKGSYWVVFHGHKNGQDGLADQSAAAVASPVLRLNRLLQAPRLAWISVLITLIAVVGLLLDRLPTHTGTAGAATASSSGIFWKHFFDAPEKPLVVYSNALFVGRPEVGMRYFDPQTDQETVFLDHYTGIGEVMAVYELSRLFSAFGEGVIVKRGSLLTWDDVKSADVIFIGSPSENLPLRELNHRSNFIFQRSPGPEYPPDLTIVNLQPRDGEETVYKATSPPPIREDYSVIRLAEGFASDRRMLTLAGITTLGTHAATEFVCREEALTGLLAALRHSPGDPIPAFEAVLWVKVSGGVPVETRIVALRVYEPETIQSTGSADGLSHDRIARN